MQAFLSFLEKTLSVYHTAEVVVKGLKKAGFNELKEEDAWKLIPGKKYFVQREGTLLCAFIFPKSKPKAATLLATHLDTPCLKLKPAFETTTQNISLLATENYGTPLLHTWMDRDLIIAGKVSGLDTRGKLVSKTLALTNSPVIIPSLALHLDREIREKGVHIHKQDHLQAFFSLNKKSLEKQLISICKIKKITCSDLFLIPNAPPSYIGDTKDMISGYGLDNHTSTFAVMHAMEKAKPQKDLLSIGFFWDHEEIGSVSTRGANSSFCTEILERILMNHSTEDLYRLKARSFCISSDLVHGFHPNFADKYDPQNAPFLGNGVAIKFNANQRYATSHESANRLICFANKNKIPVQNFATRSNIPTGSTLGPMMAAMSGIQTVDLGVPGLAMHSIRETIATKDEQSLCNLLEKAIVHDFSK